MAKSSSQSMPMGTVVMGIVVVALLASIVAIVLSNQAPAATNLSGGFGDVPRERLDDGGFVIGQPNAPITIVEFADFLCSHCQEYKETTNRFIEEFVLTGQARFEYRLFPVIDANLSTYAAGIVECVDVQRAGGFWDAYDVMFELTSSRRFDSDTARTVAQETGVDYGTLVECVDSASQWRTDAQLGQVMGVRGTPAVMMRDAAGQLSWITYQGRTYDRGGVPFEVLAGVTTAAQQ